MTTNINNANKPVMPEQAQPVLKAVTYASKEIDAEHTAIHSIESVKAEKETKASNLNKTEVAKEEQQESEQTLDNAVKQLNSYAQSINRNLEFNIDIDNGETVVKVIDSDTDELIRQIPNEETLQISKKLEAKLMNESNEPGLLLTKLQA